MPFTRSLAVILLAATCASDAGGQAHDHAAASTANASLHMEMTPLRARSAGDSVRAAAVAAELREAIARYRDTTAAVAAGYGMFLPNVKEQRVFHFTSNWRGVQEAFRFDPKKPTSLLYRKDSTGRLVLIGAMYTAPKRWDAERLDQRVPTSIARWHRHVNWCMPKRGETERWLERIDGHPVFGPESPIATKSSCDAVRGNFTASVFGWMLHANVMEGADAAAIWGDEHAGHDMSSGMKTGVTPP
jgi:hypothetical protein